MVSIIERGVPTGKSMKEYGVLKRIERIKQIWDNDQRRILEIGCGYGAYTKLLAENADLAIGLDIECKFIKEARRENSGENIGFVLASGDFLPFKDETFDSVFLIESLEHVLDEERVLKETHKVLVDEGEIIITVPNKYFPFETHSVKIGERIIEPPIPLFSWLPCRARINYERARVYTTEGLIKILEEAGFGFMRYQYIPPVLEGKLFLQKMRSSRVVMRRLVEWLFKKPIFRYFSMSILICAKKRGKFMKLSQKAVQNQKSLPIM